MQRGAKFVSTFLEQRSALIFPLIIFLFEICVDIISRDICYSDRHHT